jgi:cell division protein FtsI/penicillin-binding protein 2
MSTELRRARSRQMIIFLLVCVGMLYLSGRLYYWQVIDGVALAEKANNEHTQVQKVSAPRGLIYDAQGLLLATNIVRDDVYAEPAQIVADYPDTYQSVRDTLVQQLHQVLSNISISVLRADLDSSLPTKRIAISITPAQSEKLRAMQLSYIFLEPRTLRDYPGGTLAAQILGYVQEDTGNATPKGIYGVEAKYNTLLAGKSGSFTTETDLNGNPLTVGSSSQQPVVNGADLTLTIDSTIQYQLQTGLDQAVEQMRAESGSAIVVNARTGAIVAMAGSPSFDPNRYSQYVSDTGCRGKLEVYINPALYCAYEPGSTMKAITMAAGLDQGVITPNTAFYDSGHLDFTDGTPSVYNWEKKAYGIETMTQVLQHSANVGAAWVATQKLGASRFYPYLKSFGFGQATGVLNPEAVGSYNTPQDKNWSPSDMARQSFGQSVLVTPLQMAMAYEAIANGGVMMKPYLVSKISQSGHVTTVDPQILRRVISEGAAHQLTSMLESTAGFDRIGIPGYHVATKTGTSTIQGLVDTNTDASVAGFVPASNPQFAILVELDHPQTTIYGNSAAGPLWMSIAQQLVWHYDIAPDAQ